MMSVQLSVFLCYYYYYYCYYYYYYYYYCCCCVVPVKLSESVQVGVQRSCRLFRDETYGYFWWCLSNSLSFCYYYYYYYYYCCCCEWVCDSVQVGVQRSCRLFRDETHGYFWWRRLRHLYFSTVSLHFSVLLPCLLIRVCPLLCLSVCLSVKLCLCLETEIYTSRLREIAVSVNSYIHCFVLLLRVSWWVYWCGSQSWWRSKVKGN